LEIVCFYPFVNSFGGIERLLVDLYQECRNNGIKTRLLCFANQVDFAAYGAPDLQVTVLHGPRNLLSETLRLRRFCQQQRPTNLLVMEMCGAIYCPTLPVDYCLHIADTPALLPRDVSKYAWSYPPDPQSDAAPRRLTMKVRGELAYQLIRRGIARARSRLTMTARNCAELQRVFGLPFEYSWPGIAEAPRPMEQQPANCGFLSVCRLEPSKRVDWIIQAFVNIPAAIRAGARLDIVGDGSARAGLESLADSLGVSGAVRFHGHVSDAVLEQCYQNSSVFVMPARQGYGLPGLEALLRGLRLIVHSESGVSEALQTCERTVVISDMTSLSAAMQLCCRTHTHTRRIAANPRPRSVWVQELLERFGWM
jgi:glycosyltransferase involved in cell wall biosynthesis